MESLNPIASCLPPPAAKPLLPSQRPSDDHRTSLDHRIARLFRRVSPRSLLAASALIYGLVLLYVRESAGGGAAATRSAALSQGVGTNVGGVGVPQAVGTARGDVWADYFAMGNAGRAELPYDEFADALRAFALVEHPPDGLNLTRRTAAALAPYVDLNHDHKVGNGELFAFVSKFASSEGEGDIQQGGDEYGEETGGATAKSPYDARRLGNALVSALQLVAGEGGAPGGSGDAAGGCSLHFQRKRGSYVELVNSGSLQFGGSQPFTIEMWVRPTIDHKAMCLISKYNRGKWGQFFVKIDENGRVFFHREVAPWGQRSDRKLPVNAYTHVTVTYRWDQVRQRGESSIYLNGTVAASQREGPQDNNPETAILIGALQESSLPTEHLEGDIDDVRMWDVHRTPKEVQDSMRLRLTGMEEHLVGYWPFDECRGAFTRDALSHHDGSLRETAQGGDKSSGLGMWKPSDITLRSYSDAIGCLDTLC